MGTHCSSELNRGHISKSNTAIMKLLLLTVFVASAFATEEVADAAKPVAVAPVHAFHAVHHPFWAGLWGHQQQWPSISAPGVSSTCFGCRGKRSAEADAEPGHYGYPYGSYGYNFGSYGYPHGSYGYRAYGSAATSFEYRSPQGLRGKRSADADAEPGYYGYPYGSYGNFHGSYGYPHGSYGNRAYGRVVD